MSKITPLLEKNIVKIDQEIKWTMIKLTTKEMGAEEASIISKTAEEEDTRGIIILMTTMAKETRPQRIPSTEEKEAAEKAVGEKGDKDTQVEVPNHIQIVGKRGERVIFPVTENLYF